MLGSPFSTENTAVSKNNSLFPHEAYNQIEINPK